MFHCCSTGRSASPGISVTVVPTTAVLSSAGDGSAPSRLRRRNAAQRASLPLLFTVILAPNSRAEDFPAAARPGLQRVQAMVDLGFGPEVDGLRRLSRLGLFRLGLSRLGLVWLGLLRLRLLRRADHGLLLDRWRCLRLGRFRFG